MDNATVPVDGAPVADGGMEAATGTDSGATEESSPRLLGAEPAAGEQPQAEARPDAKSVPDPNVPEKALPEKYDLAVPDGMRLQPGQMQAFETQARELGLTGEQAQKLLETAHSNQAEAAKRHASQVERWAEECRDDPEIGGTRFDENIGIANAALKRFDPDGRITKILNETGYGNHPDVVRLFSRIGRGIAEDAAPSGSGGTQAPELSLPDRLYRHWEIKKR